MALPGTTVLIFLLCFLAAVTALRTLPPRLLKKFIHLPAFQLHHYYFHFSHELCSVDFVEQIVLCTQQMERYKQYQFHLDLMDKFQSLTAARKVLGFIDFSYTLQTSSQISCLVTEIQTLCLVKFLLIEFFKCPEAANIHRVKKVVIQKRLLFLCVHCIKVSQM